ncbi:putative type VI secretion system effector [Chromobacterium sp. LK1]|uniref:putative type VI secretion system effector n=1 Tax=Chromobacterium sp. LK1 TaxID=1628193 RepID=UPI000B1F871E|nr:putative type VI secretion system effector [Chromobacterium sp. LK1]
MSVTNDLVALTPTMQPSKISGKISRYKKTREMANFFFTDRDRNIMGLSAIAGALAGAAGIAASTARDASNLREQADYIEMEINGLPAKGWVWYSPFQDGDIVDVIGTPRKNHFEIVAIARPKDRIIALYPHCSRGKKAHVNAVVKWSLISISFLVGILVPFVFAVVDLINGKHVFSTLADSSYLYVALTMYILLGAYAFIYGRKFMMYAHAATQIFTALNLSEPDKIDLPKQTKRKPGDPGAFGVMYFNY